jgi:hypothetical protein
VIGCVLAPTLVQGPLDLLPFPVVRAIEGCLEAMFFALIALLYLLV